MVTKVTSAMLLLEGNRTLEQHLLDITNVLDYGAGAAESLATNTAAINAAIAANTSGLVLIPPGISYTEGALVFTDDVTVLEVSTFGTVSLLTKDHGTSLPLTKGGLLLKQQGITGVLLRNITNGVSTEPYLQVLDGTTGDIASLEVKYVELDEATEPAAPSSNKARLFVKDNGAGKSQLGVRFPTGTSEILATQDAPPPVNLTGTATYDPANLVNGDGITTTVTVTGAVLGDISLVSFSLDLQGITLTSYVSAADTVSVRFQNESGGAVDLGSGTLKAVILRNY